MPQNTTIDTMLNAPSLYGNRSYAEDICLSYEAEIYDKVMSLDDDDAAYAAFNAVIEEAKQITDYAEQYRRRLALCQSWAFVLDRWLAHYA